MSDSAFITLLNMSITAGYVILALLVLRLVFRRAPKGLLYALWLLPLFRLVCPVSIESMLSLLPSAQPIPTDITLQPLPQIHSGIPALNAAVNPALAQSAPAAGASANPLQIWCFAGKIIWLLGMTALLGYGILSYARLWQRLRFAVEEGGVYRGDVVPEPLVAGFFRPRIYLPDKVSGEAYILAHERAHIARGDHLVKPLAYVVLCIHWFNPLAWAAFFLMIKDMESACDERVLREQGPNERQAYAKCLLEMGMQRSGLVAPLAFGESDVKGRIKRILNYKKPAFWLVAAVLLLALILCITLLTNPADSSIGIIGGADGPTAIYVTDGEDSSMGIIGGADGPTSIFVADGEGNSAYAYGLQIGPEGAVAGINLPNLSVHPISQDTPAFTHGLAAEEIAALTPIPWVYMDSDVVISVFVEEEAGVENLTLQDTLLREDGSILYHDGEGGPLIQEAALTPQKIAQGTLYTYILEPSMWNLLFSSYGPHDTLRCFSLQYTQNGQAYEACFVLRTAETFSVTGEDEPAAAGEATPLPTSQPEEGSQPTPLPTAQGDGSATGQGASGVQEEADAAAALQQRLMDLGYLSAADLTGQYDAATRAAILQFQQQVNALVAMETPLQTDGYAGPETRWFLFS